MAAALLGSVLGCIAPAVVMLISNPEQGMLRCRMGEVDEVEA